MVGAIGKVHGLQADGGVFLIGYALLADEASIQAVCRIDLHGGLVCVDREHPAALLVV